MLGDFDVSYHLRQLGSRSPLFSAAIYFDQRCLAKSKHLVDLPRLVLQSLTLRMYVDLETRGGARDPQGSGCLRVRWR